MPNKKSFGNYQMKELYILNEKNIYMLYSFDIYQTNNRKAFFEGLIRMQIRFQ